MLIGLSLAALIATFALAHHNGRTNMTDVPEKQWVALTPAGNVEVRAIKDGAVNWRDKAKRFYKGGIAAVGAILIILMQLEVFSGLLGEQGKTLFTVAVAVLTSISVFLKSNERWIEKL